MLGPRLTLTLACACTAAGCFSTSIGQAPSTVPKGHVRVGLGAGIQASGDNGDLIHEVSLRGGVHDRIDLGIKFNPTFIEGSVKGQLVRGNFDLSIAGSAGVARDPDDDDLFDEYQNEYGAMPNARVMLLAGQRLFSSVELVAIAHGLGAHRGRGPVDGTELWHPRTLGAGGGLGVLLGSGNTRFLFEGVVTHLIEGSGDYALPQGATILQLGITAMIGGPDERDERSE